MADTTKPKKASSRQNEVINMFDDRRKKPEIGISPEIERRDSSFTKDEQWYLRIDPNDNNDQVAS